jgi:hypothetical protein
MTDDELTLYVLREFMIGSTNSGTDLRRTALCLRLARQMGIYDQVLPAVLEKRAQWRTWRTLAQRSWQTKVSRRPARGNHHDSWSIRESYVRYSG